MTQLDASGSTVILMIETAEAIANINTIASVPGVDVLLVGANDLTLELGIQGQWDHPVFRETLEKIGEACRRSGVMMGLAGLYNRPDICADAIKRLGVRYMLGNLDIGLVAAAAKANVAVLKGLEEKPMKVSRKG